MTQKLSETLLFYKIKKDFMSLLPPSVFNTTSFEAQKQVNSGVNLRRYEC